MDGDLDEADLDEAGTLALSSFEAGRRAAASELKEANQHNKLREIKAGTYTALSKTS